MKKALTHLSACRQIRPRFTLPVKIISSLALISLAAGLGLLASRPAHSVGGPVAVTVANTPLQIKDPEAARTPFQIEIVPVVEGFFTSTPYYLGGFTVPNGKRLVLQGLSANFGTSDRSESPVFAITTLAGGSAGIHNFTGTFTPGNNVYINPLAIPEQPMTVYADSDSTVSVRVDNLGVFLKNNLTITLSGYLLNTQ